MFHLMVYSVDPKPERKFKSGFLFNLYLFCLGLCTQRYGILPARANAIGRTLRPCALPVYGIDDIKPGDRRSKV